MEYIPGWIEHILALLFGLVIPLTAGYRSTKAFKNAYFDSASKKRFYLLNSLSMFLLAAIIVVSWWLHKHPFDQLGFAPVADDYGEYVTTMVICFVLLYIGDTLYSIRSNAKSSDGIDQLQDKTPFLPGRNDELPLYVLMCISAGLGEEIVFRGFLVTYSEYLFSGYDKSHVWAVVFPGLIFSLAHFYQGKEAVLKIFVLSLLFGFIFIYSGSLIIVVILHFLVDLIGGLLNMRLNRD